MSIRGDGIFADGTAGFPTIVADGSSPIVNWPGGDGTFIAVGGFGGGTATLQMRAPDGTTWLSLGTSVALTAAGVAGFSAPVCQLRVTLAGSAGPTLKAWTQGIGLTTPLW